MDLKSLISSAISLPARVEETKIVQEVNESGTEPEVSDVENNQGQDLAPDAEESESEAPDALIEGNCAHMCANSNCQEWWSHGPANKCRYPDLANQGFCPKCLTTSETAPIPDSPRIPSNINLDPSDFWMDGNKPMLSPRAQVFYRNKELITVKNMTVEQLTIHIQFYAQLIEELRVRSMQSRARRTELEEEALNDIPEEEREKFIQALRNGSKPKKVKKETAPKVKKVSAKDQETNLISAMTQSGKSLAEAKIIASMIVKTGKTQAEVEAWLND